MPTPVKSVTQMKKHLTPAQKKARERQEAATTRDKVSLVMPASVKGDIKAVAYWRNTINRMRGISLLDNMDTDTLAVYCQQMSRRDMLNTVYQQSVAAALKEEEPVLQVAMIEKAADILLRVEATERLALSYAEKLGLTPSGRVRLAKKKAEERPVDPNSDLFGDGP